MRDRLRMERPRRAGDAPRRTVLLRRVPQNRLDVRHCAVQDSGYAMACPYVLTHQLGASLWKRMRIGFTLSLSQPCSGHSRRYGKRMAPGTGLGTSFALHFGQFKHAPCEAVAQRRARLD